MWYIFTAYNTPAQYGWGEESEASAYCDYLNRERQIDCYQFAALDDVEQIARLETRRDGSGFNLEDVLAEITIA